MENFQKKIYSTASGAIFYFFRWNSGVRRNPWRNFQWNSMNIFCKNLYKISQRFPGVLFKQNVRENVWRNYERSKAWEVFWHSPRHVSEETWKNLLTNLWFEISDKFLERYLDRISGVVPVELQKVFQWNPSRNLRRNLFINVWRKMSTEVSGWICWTIYLMFEENI